METFISGLANNLEYASELGVKSVDIGMSHRGRLATLICVARKDPGEVFLDFE
jgi:2-oxoglutarate dehydrogenase complex dehydrogenase (E1) component-like enzyme